MPGLARPLETASRRALARADAWMNQLYGWRYNPLYHSGAVVVSLLAVVLVTGVYLLLFYRIGSPFESVERITSQVWVGRWVRSLHRFASDAAVLAAAVHAVRLFAQGRSWGPRALAWVSGLVLLFVILVCGWTGYVMVWDVQGQVLAQEGARLLDAVPIFSEPIGRAFAGDRPLPSAFFFLNLFLHVALPVGMGVLLWVHVARVARPNLLPPRRLMWGVVGLLLALSIVWPITATPKADLFVAAGEAPYDFFYAFWLPVSRALPAWVVWVLIGFVCAVAVTVPLWARPRAPERPPLSTVNHRLCDACEQCYQDCPYEAISMREIPGSRTGIAAWVDHDLCVGCGICTGSCAPMGVGPQGQTGRDQLAEVRAFVARTEAASRGVVIVACRRGAGGAGRRDAFEGAPVFGVECAGHLHTSVVEYLVRSGFAGVLIAACPPRDCWSREGPKWLVERLYHDREAELQARVDRRRVTVTYAAEGEPGSLRQTLDEFRREVESLSALEAESDFDVLGICEASTEEATS